MVQTGLRQIAVEELCLDEENPRLSQRGLSQDQILAAWSSDPKNYKLAADVAKRGLSPLELVAVIRHADLPKRFIIADGNRRLTALKLLHQPGLASDEARTQRFRQLAKQHSIQKKVWCMVFSSREEADPWIELRHSGEAGGVGAVSWDTTQKYHFNVRRGNPDPNADAVRFLDAARDKAWITEEQHRTVPVTTLRRVLGDTTASALLGIRSTADGPVIARPEADAKKLARTLLSALSERGAVRTIDKSKDRRAFVEKQLAIAQLKPARPVEVDQSKGEEPPSPPRKSPRKKQRRTLAARQLDFTVNHPRCDDMLTELQTLQVANTPNAAVVLFRVFVELTTDHFLEKQGTRPGRNDALLAKIRRCIAKLDSTPNELTAQKKQALEKVLAHQHHPLNPDTLNAFVHNADLHPVPSELVKMWDQLQAFLGSVWRALEGP